MPLRLFQYLCIPMLFFIAFDGNAQYSKVHYLPPTYNQNSNILFSTITVTTLVEDPFDVSIINASGTYSNILSGLSKSNPITVTLPQGDNDGIFKGNEGKTNIVLNSEGFIITADDYFFTSQIHSVSSQGAVIAPKGLAGLGTEFFSGHMYAKAGNNGVRSHFISVIASEDNTTVTFENPNVNWEGQTSTFSVFLNQGESYVLAAPFDYIQGLSVDDKFNAFNGTHVTADRPIAMNSGSFLASYSSGGQDAGVDQIVPVSQLNNEFILVQGQATNILIETAMIVAVEDNTEIFVNGDSSPAHTINKGEYAVVTGEHYNNGTMHLKTSNPAMVYQNLAGSNSFATVGMVFVPGLMEDASRSVLISGANSIGDVSIYIVAKKDEPIQINGVNVQSTPIENLGNSAWVTYRIVPSEINSLYCTSGSNCANKGVDSDFLIESSGPINAAISLISGVVGAAGYFSGFASVNTDVGVSELGILEYNLSCVQDTVSLFAKGADSYFWDSPSGNMDLVSKVNDSTYFFNYDQSGNQGPFTYRLIMESTSILGYVQNDTVVLTVNVEFTAECETDFINEDTLFICLGDSIQINANNVNETQWYGEEAFTVLNDSTIIAKPSKTTTYYFSNFIKKQNALINGDFEEPDLGVFSYQIINASTVPGWNTTASDNQIEVWYDGFLGAPAFKGKQFIELNANMSSALYQDMSTAPNTKLMWGFAHRGRDAVDDMEFEVGPPGGPYEKIGTFSDGPTWKFYSGVYEVPEGQTTTRFYYTSTQDGSYGNLLDAIEFFTLKEDQDSIVVVVNSLPNIDLGKDTTICMNDSLTIEADNAQNYLWNTSDSTASITVSSTGEYRVTIKDDNQCKNQDTIAVNFISCETDFVSEDTLHMCQGDTLLISGSNITTESWWSDDAFDLVNSSSIKVSPSNSRAVYYIGSSEIYADSVIVFVHERPKVELREDTTICYGDKVMLSESTPGAYIWNTGASSAEIEIDQPGVYRLEIKNIFGCTGLDSMELWVQELPIVNLGKDTAICEEQSIILDSKNEDLEHLWSTGESTGQITVKNSGVYSVTLTDTVGCSQSDTVEIIVHNLPVLDLGNDTSICEGKSMILSAGNMEVNRLWNTLDTSPSISVGSSGTYDVLVTDSFGCSNSDSIKILINELPIINLGNDTALCDGQSIELNAENLAFNSVWSTGETTSKITVFTEDIYSVEVTDDYGCIGRDSLTLLINEVPKIDIGNDTTICEGKSIELIAETSAEKHFWSTGDSTLEITVSESNWYKIEVQNVHGCSGKDSMRLTVNSLPSVELGKDTTICKGQNIILEANSIRTSYLWSTGETKSAITVSNGGVYSVTVSDPIGCKTKDSLTVDIRELPVVNLGRDRIICENETLILNSNFGDAYNVLWQDGSHGKQITIFRKGVYKAEVTDNIGCSGKDEIEVSMEFLPDPFTEKEFSFCEGNNLELSPDIGYENHTIYWLKSKWNSKFTVFESGVYSSVIEGDYCIDTIPIYVTKMDTPNAVIKDVNSKGHYCFEYESTHLNVLIDDQDDFTIEWDDFGTTDNVEITEEGNYAVTVSSESCTSRYSSEIEDFCPGNLFVPNSFTPNSDGLNDVFMPVWQGEIDSYQFTIFDRWNGIVFYTNDINKGWDGGMKDNLQDNDVYVYKISFNYITVHGGTKHESIVGTVTLLR